MKGEVVLLNWCQRSQILREDESSIKANICSQKSVHRASMLAAQPPIPQLASSERPRSKETVAFLHFSPEKQLEVCGFTFC